jgi:hypothetical protein
MPEFLQQLMRIKDVQQHLVDLATKIAENEIFDCKHKPKSHMAICLTTVKLGLLLLLTVMPTLLGIKHAGNGKTWRQWRA